MKAITRFLIGFILLVSAQAASAQYTIKGNVYDSSRVYPIEAVSVLSTNGHGTMTDSLGHYQIDVREKDSIWFSYLGKPTPKYPVLKIVDINHFDLALRLKMDVMKEVKIKARNYRQDSIQNRKDYAKIFNFQRPNITSMTSIGPTGAGIDLDELIRVFQFRKNRETMRFKERLIEQEHEKFVDHRFNRGLVRKLTGLDGDSLEVFMLRYRPSYEFTLVTGDYDFQLFIKKAGEDFKTNPQPLKGSTNAQASGQRSFAP
ncbi:MAG TPA: hypothetical protein VNS32_28440 [Flavisolibacter sp.]|nr:hypothetical protein [Flavisolibacter sp.]